MLVSRALKSRGLAVGVAAAFVFLSLPIAEFAAAKAAPQAPGAAVPAEGSLVGFVFTQDMRTPVANAVVMIRNINEQTSYSSAPSDANGMYAIKGIKEGRYVLGVAATEGDYNFDYVMALKGSEMAKLSLALNPGGQMTGADPAKKSFFPSAGGVMIVVMAAGAVLYAVFAAKDEESPIIR